MLGCALMATKDFADALAAELGNRGISQASLAEAVGMKQNTVSRWVRGDFAPPTETVFAIEVALVLAPGTLSKHLGYLPLGVDAPPVSISSSIDAAPELEDWQKDALRAVYRTFTTKRATTGSKRTG